MTKLCPRGKAAAKRKFKVYPSAYANAYASKICAGKIKDPSGTKRKDFKGPKPASANVGTFAETSENSQNKRAKPKIQPRMSNSKKYNTEARRRKYSTQELTEMRAKQEAKRMELMRQRMLKRNRTSKKMTKMYSEGGFNNVSGHAVTGSPISVDIDGDMLSNPSASDYYKDLL
tara:strand:+ start:871 stop:1392 length:522 start_codon:yes stop_codon:yes gene_type:complete